MIKKMWAFSFKGRVEIVDFALQSGENPYYEMEKICYCKFNYLKDE